MTFRHSARRRGARERFTIAAWELAEIRPSRNYSEGSISGGSVIGSTDFAALAAVCIRQRHRDPHLLRPRMGFPGCCESHLIVNSAYSPPAEMGMVKPTSTFSAPEISSAFNRAPWVHKARELPREEFKREVERHLTGEETEPREILCFKAYSCSSRVATPGCTHGLPPEPFCAGFAVLNQKYLSQRMWLK